MNKKQVLPIPLSAMARQLNVPTTWLRSEAEAGRIPHIKAGSTLLFDQSTVERIVMSRLRAAAKGVSRG